MEQDILNEPLFKERSYVKSISAGTRLPLRHPLGFLRQIWPLIVINMLVFAALSGRISTDIWTFYQEAIAPGKIPSDLISSSCLMVLGWGYTAMLLLGVLAGQVAYLMQRYAELNYLPAVKPWKIWYDIHPHVLHGILLCIVGYTVTVGFALLSLAVMPSRLWALVLFMFLTMLWAIYYVPVGQHFMMEHRSFLSALLWPAKHIGQLGGSTAILIVCGIILILVILAGSIPTICTIYVGGLSDQSVLNGDGTDIHSSFGFICALSYAMTFLVATVAWTFIFVPLCFHWGSEQTNQNA